MKLDNIKREHKNYFIKRYVEPLQIEQHFEFVEKPSTLSLKFKELLVTQKSCVALLVLDFENNFSLYYPYEEDKRNQFEKFDLPEDEKPLVFELESPEKLFAYTRQTLALIYSNKKVKLFEQYMMGVKVELDLDIQAKMIVGKSRKFHILLEDTSIIVVDEMGVKLEEEGDKTLFTEEIPKVNKEIIFKKFGIDCLGDLWLLEEETQLLYHFLKTKFYANSKDIKLSFDAFDSNTNWSTFYVEWELPSDTKVEIDLSVDDGVIQTFTNLPTILLYDFKGQVLHVKIRFYSNVEEENAHTLSPSIKELRATFNEKSYVEYLPNYYQQDKEVLSRYLSIFQESMFGLEQKIEKNSELLNPMLCDEEYLAWLSTLLGIQRDFRWEEKRWRIFLSKLPQLYKGLGTKKVMQEVIALYCDEVPKIEDEFVDKPWDFCVSLSAKKLEVPKDTEVIESLIEAFKPAHTFGRLSKDDKEHFIVEKSFLTMNTKL